MPPVVDGSSPLKHQIKIGRNASQLCSTNSVDKKMPPWLDKGDIGSKMMTSRQGNFQIDQDYLDRWQREIETQVLCGISNPQTSKTRGGVAEPRRLVNPAVFQS